MGERVCPCKGCTDRWVSESSNCHVHCKDYIEWAEYTRECNRRKNKQKKILNIATDLYLNRRKRWNK